jgi:hypothetical protein
LERDLADLGHSVHQLGDLFPEVFADLLETGQGIFDGIMEQPGCHTGNVESQLSQNSSDLQRMIEIRLSGKANLTQVNLGRKDVGLS